MVVYRKGRPGKQAGRKRGALAQRKAYSVRLCGCLSCSQKESEPPDEADTPDEADVPDEADEPEASAVPDEPDVPAGSVVPDAADVSEASDKSASPDCRIRGAVRPAEHDPAQPLLLPQVQLPEHPPVPALPLQQPVPLRRTMRLKARTAQATRRRIRTRSVALMQNLPAG